MSPKQKRALAALILAAIAGGSAALAPGLKCEPPPAQTIEDLIPDEPSETSGPGAKEGTAQGSDSGGLSESESSSEGLSAQTPPAIVAPSGDSGSTSGS